MATRVDFEGKGQGIGSSAYTGRAPRFFETPTAEIDVVHAGKEYRVRYWALQSASTTGRNSGLSESYTWQVILWRRRLILLRFLPATIFGVRVLMITFQSYAGVYAGRF